MRKTPQSVMENDENLLLEEEKHDSLSVPINMLDKVG